VIFNDLHSTTVAECVHECVVDSQNEVLHLVVILKTDDFQQLFRLFERNVASMVPADMASWGTIARMSFPNIL
jgi:hypothetical protein